MIHFSRYIHTNLCLRGWYKKYNGYISSYNIYRYEQQKLTTNIHFNLLWDELEHQYGHLASLKIDLVCYNLFRIA